MATIVAYRVQIAVPLASTAAAQSALDIIMPDTWALSPEPGAIKALSVAPTVPAYAVGSGRINSAQYAQMAAISQSVSLSHLPVSEWQLEEGEELEVVLQGVGNLWTEMSLVDVEDE